MLSGPATRPETPLAVENSVGKLAAKARLMPARERERGALPTPILSLLDRKVERGLCVLGLARLVLTFPRVPISVREIPP